MLDASRARNPFLAGITLERLQAEGTVPLNLTPESEVPFADGESPDEALRDVLIAKKAWLASARQQTTHSEAPLSPGELRLTLRQKAGPGSAPVSLDITPGGDVKVLNGAAEVKETAGGKRYEFGDGGVAEVAHTKNGTRVTTDGALPVVLAQGPDGLELSVGDQRTTAVLNQITRNLISAKLINRRDYAHISQRLDVDVNLLNFKDTDKLRSLHTSSLRWQSAITGGLIRAIARR